MKTRLASFLLLLALTNVVSAAPLPFSVPKAPPLPERPAYRAARAEPDCADAPTLVVTPDLADVLTGDTTGGTSLVDGYACVGWQETGPEAVWLLDVTEDTFLHVVLDSEADLDLFLLTDCDSDSCAAWHASEFQVPLTARAEPYVLVVDGYMGEEGPFDLGLKGYSPGPSADVCGSARNSPCDETARSHEGNLYGLPNLLLSDDCSAFLQFGGEEWYRVTLEDTVTLTAEIESPYLDASMWLYDGCDSDAACLVFVDEESAGVNETLVYQNETGAAQTVYLAVDAFRAPEGEETASYALTLTCTGQIVANERRSLSDIKAMYR